MQVPPVYLPPTPGGSSGTGDEQPVALVLFRIYAVIQGLIFLAYIVTGGFMLAAPALGPSSHSTDDVASVVIGIALTSGGLLMVGAMLVGLFGGRKPWMHTYGAVIAISSFVCGGCWPLGIVVLVYWLKPETKQWFTSQRPGEP